MCRLWRARALSGRSAIAVDPVATLLGTWPRRVGVRVATGRAICRERMTPPAVDRVALVVAQIARIEIVACIPSQPVGHYRAAMAKTGLDIPGAGTCPSEEQIPQLLAFTRDEDPKVRRLSLKHLCPCRLQRQRDAVWARVFELTKDRDPGVRRDAVHAMTDGSPREYAEVVQSHLESMRRDPDPRVRKYVNRTLDAIRRTGRVNVN